MHRHTTLVALIAATVLAGPAAPQAAAAKSSARTLARESVYRCRDAEGRAYVAQSIPAECMDQDVEVLDGSGRVVRIIPGRSSLADEQERQEAEAARVAAANRDKTLLATYLSVADIERLRDQRLELLVQQARVTEQYIVNLRDRESRLVQDVRRFRPYSDEPGAPALPDHVAEDIVNTVNGLQVYQQQLAKNTEEQERLRTEFASDIARFKELRGIR